MYPPAMIAITATATESRGRRRDLAARFVISVSIQQTVRRAVATAGIAPGRPNPCPHRDRSQPAQKMGAEDNPSTVCSHHMVRCSKSAN
jgi:hypothetical protein